MTALADGSFESYALPTNGLAEAVPGTPGADWSPAGTPWTFNATGAAARAGLVRNGNALVGGNPAAPYGQQVAFLQEGGACWQTVTADADVVVSIALKAAGCADSGTPGTPDLALYVNGEELALFHLDTTSYADYSCLASLHAGSNTILFEAVAAGGGVSMALLDSEGPDSGGWVQLRHSSGQGRFRSRGDISEVWAGGALREQWPFGTLETTPTEVLGKDAGTGLPQWSAIAAPPAPPAPVSSTFGTNDQNLTGTTDDPMPAAPPPDTARMCGAATDMSNALADIYNLAVDAINAGLASWIGLITGALQKSIAADLAAALTASEVAPFLVAALPLALSLIIAAAGASLLGGLHLPTIQRSDHLHVDGDDIYIVIRCCAFKALQENSGDYLYESAVSTHQGTKDVWLAKMQLDWALFRGSTIPGVNGTTDLPWQLVMLKDIINTVGDGFWSLKAYEGSSTPTTHCDVCASLPP